MKWTWVQTLVSSVLGSSLLGFIFKESLAEFGKTIASKLASHFDLIKQIEKMKKKAKEAEKNGVLHEIVIDNYREMKIAIHQCTNEKMNLIKLVNQNVEDLKKCKQDKSDLELKHVRTISESQQYARENAALLAKNSLYEGKYGPIR